MIDTNNANDIICWLTVGYPITIIADRYSGIYSGGLFMCWPLDYYEIPVEPDASDVPCANFWETYDKNLVGFGDTPDEALQDLRCKLTATLEKDNKNITILPPDMDPECIELCNTLNSLPLTETFDSCSGHGKRPFSIWFKCRSLDVISRLGKTVGRNYSDGNWEVVVDSTDTDPTGIFWLRTKTILEEKQLQGSIEKLIANIRCWG